MSPRILGLIVARGGSKGVPRKNLQEIAGLSLIGYKARAALAAGCCARLIISSEDAEILEEGRRHGAETPFVRPDALATDTATSDAVVLHAMAAVEEEEAQPYDAVLLLQPSSPFATPEHLRRGAQLWVERAASLVVGMRRVAPHSMFAGPLRPDGRADRIIARFADVEGTRRQDVEPEYTMNGSFYFIDWKTMRRTGRIYGDPERTFGLVMDDVNSCDIDSLLDLAFAAHLVNAGLLDISPWKDRPR